MPTSFDRTDELRRLKRVEAELKRLRAAVFGETSTPAFEPCAIHMQQFGGGNLVVTDGSGLIIPFEVHGSDPVYFENKLGSPFPAIGSSVPPGAGESMYSTGQDYSPFAPISGLYGFFGQVPWEHMPLGAAYFAQAYTNGGPVGQHVGAREELLPGPDDSAASVVVGTTFMEAGDYLFMRAFQFSGADQEVHVGGSAGPTDNPANGPILAMWLLAPAG